MALNCGPIPGEYLKMFGKEALRSSESGLHLIAFNFSRSPSSSGSSRVRGVSIRSITQAIETNWKLSDPCITEPHLLQGRREDFSKGGGERGSHCVKHYRHGVFATEYCRLFS